ncbi:DUF1622 domain-containing protein [Aquicella lusitana]|uniref:Putative membrane protein n=1 Tax=Aquicella lusitana TaxID=254246 RepID=A0A370GFI9_9COXI|nr:DUF1622 domain-containing protein [Aquicella lusitana]RDI42447.1 putative membrane protein [Aquicella lusitana]VVC74091.1 hypothetical protein AQULUS_18550 [Aquicella lusitana]
MDWQIIHTVLVFMQRTVSTIGILIIISGVAIALVQYLFYILTGQLIQKGTKVNDIRLNLGRILILGLEFIVAADLIGTTTTPDYYAVGLLAIIVVIRTLLSFSINRELIMLSKER